MEVKYMRRNFSYIKFGIKFKDVQYDENDRQKMS